MKLRKIRNAARLALLFFGLAGWKRILLASKGAGPGRSAGLGAGLSGSQNPRRLRVRMGQIRGRMRQKGATEILSFSFNVMRILAKQTDGNWKVHRTICNSVTPLLQR